MAQGLIKTNQDLTPDAVKQEMQIPAEFKQAYEKVVAAGMTIMFSKESSKAALSTIQNGKGPIAQRLGQAIAALLAMIYKEANNSLPPQVMIPAGVELLMQAADFLRRAGLEEVNNQAIGDAMDVMVTTILKAAGFSVDKMVGFVDQKSGGPAPQMAGPAPQMGA